MITQLARWVVAVWLVSMSGALSKPAPLTLRLQPLLCTEPCTMTATATAQPDTANKFLELVVDGDNYSTDDVQPITADGGQFVIMPTLSAGHYRFYAILFRLVDSNLKDVSHVYYDYTVGE